MDFLSHWRFVKESAFETRPTQLCMGSWWSMWSIPILEVERCITPMLPLHITAGKSFHSFSTVVHFVSSERSFTSCGVNRNFISSFIHTSDTPHSGVSWLVVFSTAQKIVPVRPSLFEELCSSPAFLTVSYSFLLCGRLIFVFPNQQGTAASISSKAIPSKRRQHSFYSAGNNLRATPLLALLMSPIYGSIKHLSSFCAFRPD